MDLKTCKMDNIKVEPNTPELQQKLQGIISDLEKESVKYNRMWTEDVIKLVKQIAEWQSKQPANPEVFNKPLPQKEQPNTPELMAEYLIENHRPYADATETNFFLDSVFSKERETKNAIQSAIVSAEVALNVAIDMNDFHNYRREAKITFWEQTIKYLNDKL